MNSLCVVLMLMWLSNGQVTSSAIPISIQAGMKLGIEGGHLDSLQGESKENILLRMVLELSSGDQSTPPKTLVENIQADDSNAATATPRPPTTTTTMRPNTPKECPLDFVKLGAHCYYFSMTEKVWSDALRSCVSLNATLVHPMSAVEDSLITTHLRRNHKGVEEWWIGGTDQYEEGQWVWAHDKLPIRYTNWVYSALGNSKTFNCAYYYQSIGYKWDDNVCTNRYQFICQQRDLDNVSRPLLRGGGDSTKDIDGLSDRGLPLKTFLSLN